MSVLAVYAMLGLVVQPTCEIHPKSFAFADFPSASCEDVLVVTM